MFTGIVKTIGSVSRVESRGGDLRLTIRSSGLDWPVYEIGESFCINGVCLTAVRLHPDGFDTDLSRETMTVTALAGIAAGDRVNVEPSLALGERLGGHLVSGHIDCVGTVVTTARDARSIRLDVEIPMDFRRYVARKGSICVDGVSLTINSVSANTVSLNIIPHTVNSTIIGGYEVGTKVNIEVDLLARYIERLLSKDDKDGVSMDLLREHGYAK
ncbi:MAG: riboflavin synthase [Gammaproteobacteria bacterium]|nr:riboflavin synthase [Gammaproteobacteria bacterium]MDH4314820.1 riboflavin synthase [Gammaproteobacteria bacterium]MDH5213095.1 riboflavin synthase [Gammaproteobacteria bacterium]MDH5499861.1 riboflavin synthase [Gammaproteobacteria bacterium]